MRGALAVARVGLRVTRRDLSRDDVETDAAETRRRRGEVLVDDLLAEAERLEHLGAAVGGDGRDAHLRHDLEQALAERLDEVLDGLLGRRVTERTLVGELLDGLHREVRVDERRTVADEQRDVVDLAHVAGLDDEPDLQTRLLTDEVVVHRRRQQQRRDRRELGVRVTIGQDDEAVTVGDRLVDLGEDALQACLERARTTVDAVRAADDVRREAGAVAVGVDVDDLGELVVVDDGEAELDLLDVLGAVGEQVALRTHRRAEARDELLADRVERRVRHLREQLREVVEQQARARAEDGDGRVGAHRTERLGARRRHRRQQDLQLLVRVAERLLTARDRAERMGDVFTIRQVADLDDARVEPLLIRLRRGEFTLDLLVRDDAPGLGVDEEHLARL